MDKYIVSVGNIGNIEVDSHAEGLKVFDDYKEQSKSNIGRCAGENVYLLCNDEIALEYTGTIEQANPVY